MAGIYIHIPFCKKACNYCNFHFSTSTSKIQDFIDALIIEIGARKDYISENISSIYLGGGTPSLLSIDQLNTIFNALKTNYLINDNIEITLEVNPENVNENNLINWKKTGINRLSMGVQTLNQNELLWMNRSHNSSQALMAIDLVAQHFSNFSIDLIYGSPLLTDANWLHNLKTVLAFNPPHLSCYALTVEEGTLLHYQVKKKLTLKTKPVKQARHFKLLQNYLKEQGYLQYEISNFCKPNCASKHNSSYWESKNYIGFGPSAHSFNGISRSWNVSNNAIYIKGITNLNSIQESEMLTTAQQFNEFIMIGLRTSNGIDINEIIQKFPSINIQSLIDDLLKFVTKKLINRQLTTYTLTNKGMLFADGIASDLFLIE